MRWLRNQSIRARITISSVLIGAVLIAVAAFAFRASVGTLVESSTHTLLGSDAAPYESVIRRGSTSVFAAPGEDQVLAVVDPAGRVRVSNLPDSLADRVPQLVTLGRGLHLLKTSPKFQYYVLNENVHVADGDWHIITARNRDEGSVVLQGLDAVIIVGSILLVIGFGVATWIVTGLALRPVSRMRERAQQLSATSSDARLPVGRARDELAELAETLNTFITSVRASADRERQMVADASHELRTPIAVLTTQLQLAHLSSGDAEALEREIFDAQNTLDRLSNLATNLLTLSRIEAAEATVTTASDAIEAEFLSSMDRAIVLGSANGVSVDYAITGSHGAGRLPILPADFASLVDNLVSNAVGASDSGSAVEVELNWHPARLIVSVTDSGRGIDDEFLTVAFDRFTRSPSSRTQTLGGNGLGLAIVKAIITRSGGDARLEQRAEGGVRAVVELPLVAS